MTHARWHNSWEAALVGALHNLTDAELREATGRSRDYLSKLSVPGNGRELWFSHAVALDKALVAKGLPPQFLPLLKDQVGEQPAARESIDKALLLTMSGVGDLARAVTDAMADGRLDTAERINLHNLADDAIKHLREIITTVETSREDAAKVQAIGRRAAS